MKPGSTLFLRGVVVLMGLTVLALCLFALPAGIRAENAGGYRFILLGMYLPAAPFFIGMYQTLKLLDYIDKHKAFSSASIKALKIVRYCALAVSAVYAVGLPYIIVVANRDDAPGVALLGLIFTFTPMAIAVFAAVLEKLLHHALAIKSENDLTV